MKKTIFLLAILFLPLTQLVWADEVSVSSSVDKRQAQIDQEIALTLRIVGAQGNVPAPRLPALEGFDSFYTGRTSQFTFVNGQSSSTVEFNYVLVPKVAGKFVLDPIEVWVREKRFQTEPLQVEVLGPSLPPGSPGGGGVASAPRRSLASPPPASPKPSLVQDDNVFIRANVDKTTAYPNEQILLTYTLFTRYDTRYEGFEEEPSVSGFWIEDFPLDRDLGKEAVTLQGKRYVKADIRKIALFPTSAAEYTIDPGLIKVSVREQPKTTSLFDDFFNDSFFSGASFFARRVDRLLAPDPIKVRVRPLPETGRPEGFQGVVGSYRMSASLDKNEVKQNEPVTLTLVIEGEGNIETLPRPPIPDLTGFKVYPGDTSTELFKAGRQLGGKKSFEIIFIPTEAGALAVPPLTFSFFNPTQETYQVLRAPSFPLKVMPSEEPFRLPAELAQKEVFKKEVRLEAKDIRYIHQDFASGREERLLAFLFPVLLSANVLGLLFVGRGLWKRYEEVRFSQDEGLRRRKLARAIAMRKLKSLQRLAGSQKEEEAVRFVGEAERALTEYLSNKFNVSAYQFTKEWLQEKLGEAWGVEDHLLKQIEKFYDLASETRFGRGTLPVVERRQFVKLVERVIGRVEKL